MIISIKDYEREFGRDPEKDMKEHTIVRINDKEYIIDNVTHTVTYRFFVLIRMRGGSVEFSEIKRTPDKFCICYLSDIQTRILNAKDYFMGEYQGRIVKVTDGGFETKNLIFKFVDCKDDINYLGLRADKAIIDFRDPMRGIAKIITAASRYPENARITDDRSYGIVDRR